MIAEQQRVYFAARLGMVERPEVRIRTRQVGPADSRGVIVVRFDSPSGGADMRCPIAALAQYDDADLTSIAREIGDDMATPGGPVSPSGRRVAWPTRRPL